MSGRKGKIDGERLKKLYAEGRTQRSIASSFGVSPQAVSVAMRRFGIKRREWPLPLRLAERLSILGFADLGAYFWARARSTFTTMAAELGVNGITVAKRYSRWIEEYRAAEKHEMPR